MGRRGERETGKNCTVLNVTDVLLPPAMLLMCSDRRTIWKTADMPLYKSTVFPNSQVWRVSVNPPIIIKPVSSQSTLAV